MSFKPLYCEYPTTKCISLKSWNSKEVWTGRSQMLSIGNFCDYDAVDNQVPQYFIFTELVNHHCQLVLHLLRVIGPVQVACTRLDRP